jgi:outer membrane beta-barrel protein
MVTRSTMKTAATPQRLVAACVTGLACLLGTQAAQAQEILMSGPLAGAPAVRKLRLYREGRFELAPMASFSVLNQYTHTVMVGATLNYNFTDWLALGVWGTFGAVQIPTALTDKIETFQKDRHCTGNTATDQQDCSLTAVNLPANGKLSNQTGQLSWIAAPMLTITPFRGKISMFSSLFVDTEFHFLLGAAAVGLSERADCGPTPGTSGGNSCVSNHSRKSRTAFTGTFGLGFTFFTHDWGGLSVDWRALPLSRNTGGFDTAGSGANDAFPDLRINNKDREFAFNQLVTVGYSIFLPFEHRISE